MAPHANGLVAYRENPHTDARDAASALGAAAGARAERAAVLPRMFVLQSRRSIWPPTGTGTADRPMRDLEALARAIEAEHPAIWAVNVVGGYSFSDVPEAGVAFSLVTHAADAPRPAKRWTRLDRDGRRRCATFGLPEEWDLDAAVAEILRLPGGPYLIVEPADNIGGGAPGDGTSVLRAFLRHGIENSAVAIADPAAVAALAGAGPANVRTACRSAARAAAIDRGPGRDRGDASSARSDGAFRAGGPATATSRPRRASHFSMGPSRGGDHGTASPSC